MMKEKNVFIFDLDGTIIENNNPLDKRIAEKIYELEKDGHKVIFATSRSLRGIKTVLPQSLWNNTLILCNGAFVLDKGKIVLSNFINSDECMQLISYLCNKQIQFYAELGRELYIPNYVKHDFISLLREEAQGEIIYSDFIDICNKVYKIAIVESIEKMQFYQLSELLNTSRMYCHSDNSADIISSEISKWEAFKKLNIFYKYNQVIAFGNDENDMELLSNADIGVAVATENEDLLSVSNLTVSSCSPNMIINVIDKFYIGETSASVSR